MVSALASLLGVEVTPLLVALSVPVLIFLLYSTYNIIYSLFRLGR